MEYPDKCIIAIRHVVRKVAVIEGGLIWLGDNICYKLKTLELVKRINLVLD